MRRYQVRLDSSARRQFRALPRDVQDRIQPAIDGLCDNPLPRASRKLQGGGGLYRLRVGSYRVVYTIHADVLIVRIIRIAHRREAYR